MNQQSHSRNNNGAARRNFTAAQPGGQVAAPEQPQWLSLPFEQQLELYAPQIAAVLPSHITPEKFRRVVLTAINLNPDLLRADRRSLFNACVRAANDGLLPDGKEGALVVFNTAVRRKDANGRTVETWEKRVQWMPMYQGLIKRARNTGELASIAAHVVYERDRFAYVLGDEERILHEPYIGADRGRPVGAYAIAHLKDGTIQREFVPVAEIEAMRATSRAPDSPAWGNWWSEMARKCAIRRLAKYLPASSELDRALDADETLQPADTEAPPRLVPPRPTRDRYGAAVEATMLPADDIPQDEPAHGQETAGQPLEAIWEGTSPQLDRVPEDLAEVAAQRSQELRQ